jgi:hypothetical protein
MPLQGQAKTDYQRDYMRRRRAQADKPTKPTKPASKPAPSDEGETDELKRRIRELEAEARQRGEPTTRTVSLKELMLKLGPILKALNIEADKKVAGLIAPVIIRTIANDLQKCLHEWMLPIEKQHVPSLTTKQKKTLSQIYKALSQLHKE